MTRQVLFTSYEPDELKALISEVISVNILKRSALREQENVGDQKQILTRQETAALLGISLPTLHSYTMSGVITAYRLGNKVRYRYSDIQDALQKINI